MKINRVYCHPLSTIRVGQKFYWSDQLGKHEMVRPVKHGAEVRNLDTGVVQFLSDTVLVSLKG